MGLLRLSSGAVICLTFAATGCTQTDFPDTKAQAIISSAPIHLDAEQVSLTQSQVECGVQNELWEAPSGSGGGGVAAAAHSTARLLPAGRDLHFDDDVVVSEPGFRQPYAQVRGDFMVQLADGPSIRDDGSDGKLVEGKLMVIIPQTCFARPLPVLGVRKGKFSEDASPVIEFRLQNDGWRFDKLVH